jgi:ATP-binding cassette subfamily G (WHITE) protein 2
VPDYFVWLDPLSYVKYAYIGACLNELPDVVYRCVGTAYNTSTNITRTGICDATLPTSGAIQIHSNGYDFISYGGCVGALIGYLVLIRFAAYTAMTLLKN